MTARIALVLLAAAAVTAVPLADGDRHGAMVTLAILLGSALLALGAARVATLQRARLGRLSHQFAAAIAIAIVPLVLAVVVTAALMFVSHHDAVMVSLIALFAGAVAVLAAEQLTGDVLRDVQAVHERLIAVSEGELEAHAVAHGSDELANLAAAANTMSDRLAAEEHARDQAEQARRDLVAAVSHDLRTPITSLQLLATAVGDDILDDATRRIYLDRMGTHIHALSELIDDLFELSRLEAGEIRWSLERVRLDDVIEETIAAMRVQADAKGVVVRAEVAPRLGLAHANPEKIQRVLFNLIQNAIRHTPEDGSVTVRAESVEAGIAIEVTDTGDGIPAAEGERVFEPFYRGGTEAARTSAGAGLGLAISRAIVEAHGGRIWLVPTTAGACVRFDLPAAP